MWTTISFNKIYAELSKNGLNRPRRVRGNGYKMINMGELFAYDRIKDQDMDLVPMNETEKKLFSVKSGDLLFARQSLIASGAGKCSIVLDTPELTTFESHIIRVRLDQKRASPLFYYYYFTSPMGKGNVQSLVMQVAAAGIRGSELAELQVPYPPLPTQRKIADILSAYDDLIENNTRRISILEEMAQSLYQEWFVYFRFSGHEQVKMVESELGMIPEGWKVVRLGDVARVNLLSVKKGNEPDEINYVDINSVSTGQINKVEAIPFNLAPGRARRIVKHGDIIWSTVRPNRRSYSIILNPPENMIVSTGFAVISARFMPYTYLYSAITTENFVDYLTNRATGSAYPAVNTRDFEIAPVLLPPSELINEFDNVVVNIFQQKQNLLMRNANLHRTRDLLLPKLISGEIDVEAWDAEELAAVNVERVAASGNVERQEETDLNDSGSLARPSLWG